MPRALAPTLTPKGAPPSLPSLETAAARATLRTQLARLERRLGELAYELGIAGRSLPLPIAGPPTFAPAPRVLGLGELEQVRDLLVNRIRLAEAALARRVTEECEARDRLEQMVADPPGHRFEVVTRSDLGVPGCGAYHVRPRLGLLGMLFGWWCVKLSSGCP